MGSIIDNLCHKHYNDNYFEFMIRQDIEIDPTYDTLVIMKIKNLIDYNRKNSWKGGNTILSNIGEYIASYPNEYTLFRVRGDIFLTLMYSEESKLYIDFLNAYKPKLEDNGLEAEIKKMNFNSHDFSEVDDMEILL